MDVAVGSTHCLALTESGEVYSWGSNDQCQHFDTLRIAKPEPSALPGLDSKHIVGISCGPAQVCVSNLVVLVDRKYILCRIVRERDASQSGRWNLLFELVRCITLSLHLFVIKKTSSWKVNKVIAFTFTEAYRTRCF